MPNLCHSEPGPKPGEEPAVRAVTARVERTLLSVAFDLAGALNLTLAIPVAAQPLPSPSLPPNPSPLPALASAPPPS